MILFKSDWDLYPNAIPHVTTKNKSARKLAQLLKLAGVENYYFFLALHNPDLKDLDPFDEKNLTTDQKMAIAIECSENPWYLFRECVKAPPMSGVNPEEFRLNIANIALFWNFFLGFTIFLIQPRQTGKSFSIHVLIYAYLSFYAKNTSAGYMTKSDSNRVADIEKIKKIFKNVPSYLNFRTKYDSDNKTGLEIKMFANNIITAVGRSSETDAMDVGRGFSFPMCTFDEACYTDNIETILSSAANGMRAAIEAARKNNQPAGIIYSSTVGMKSDRDGAYMYNIYKNGAKFLYKHFDAKNRDELTNIYSLASKDPGIIVIIDINHRQLGYTDKEWKDAIIFGRNTKQMAEIDLLNIWSDGSSMSVFTKKEQDIIARSSREPEYVEISDEGFTMIWFISESEIHRYMNEDILFTLDTSDGAGGDFLAFTALDTQTGELLAAGEYNRINTAKFAIWIADKLVKFKHSVMIIEKRANSSTIIDNIERVLFNNGINIFTKMFNWIIDENNVKNLNEINQRFVSRNESYYVSFKESIGYATSGSGKQSRNNLYGSSNLSNAIKYVGDKIKYKGLVNALLSLINKNGRVDHPDKKNDDICVSWLLGYWFLMNGRNKDKYVFKNSMVLTKITELGENVDSTELFNQIIHAMKEMKGMLSKDNPQHVNYKIIATIDKLKRNIPADAVNDANVRDFLNTISDHNIWNKLDMKTSPILDLSTGF